MKPGALIIEDHEQDWRHTLAMQGELDIATAPDLEALMVELCTGDAREVVLDLSDLDFLDSTGLRAILVARELCETHGCGFFMTRGKESVQRALETSGALKRLPFL
jgi:anti-anti-sigma factor